MGIDEIKKAVFKTIEQSTQREAISRVFLFGSQLEGTADEQSDVDLIVDFAPGSKVGMFDLYDLEQAFKSGLGKEVDLTTPAGLDELIRGDILEGAYLLYEK